MTPWNGASGNGRIGDPPAGGVVCAVARPDTPIQAQIELTLAKSCRRV
jgi:hypothetical protein